MLDKLSGRSSCGGSSGGSSRAGSSGRSSCGGSSGGSLGGGSSDTSSRGGSCGLSSGGESSGRSSCAGSSGLSLGSHGSSGGNSGDGSLLVALCTLMALIWLTSTHLWSYRLHVYAVYDSSYDNHPLSQKLDPRL